MMFWTTLIRLYIMNQKNKLEDWKQQIKDDRMEVLHPTNIVISVIVCLSGYYYMARHSSIWHELSSGGRSKSGWSFNNYGWDLGMPTNYFSYLLIGTAGYALYVSVQTYQKKWEWFGMAGSGIAFLTLLFGMWLRMTSSEISVTKSAVIWHSLLALNIFLSAIVYAKVWWMQKDILPASPHDILDDPNTITYRAPKENE